MPEILGLTSPEVLALAAEGHLADRTAAAAVCRGLWTLGPAAAATAVLDAAAQARWTAAFSTTVPALLERHETADASGPTTKFILGLADGERIECVLLALGRGRTSLCTSTQAGCRLGCAICATGRGGFRRDLSATEIVGQVLAVRLATGRRPDHVTLMGMGEPLDNVEAVIQALRVLQDVRGAAYAQDGLTLCTVGLIPGLRRLRTEGWRRLNLTLSLHAADDGLRARLLPAHRHSSLANLQAELAAWPRRRNFCFGVNWCLLPGINDRPADAAALADFCRPLGRVLVHLLPWNPVPGLPYRVPTLAETEAFVALLRAAGLPVRRRIVKGLGIAAACGMLGGPPDAGGTEVRRG